MKSQTFEKLREGLGQGIQIRQRLIETHLESIAGAGKILVNCLKYGNKILICGNGGSAADAQHFATELVVRLNQTRRRALPCLALTTDTSTLTACSNDFGFEQVFARQIEALGKKGDCLVALSTSGNSSNILNAVMTARKSGMRTIGLTGQSPSRLAKVVDLALVVPSSDIQRIQEAHITILHLLAQIIEDDLVYDL